VPLWTAACAGAPAAATDIMVAAPIAAAVVAILVNIDTCVLRCVDWERIHPGRRSVAGVPV